VDHVTLTAVRGLLNAVPRVNQKLVNRRNRRSRHGHGDHTRWYLGARLSKGAEVIDYGGMNKKALKKLLYRHVRVRPIARRVDNDGSELPVRDDEWFIERVDADAADLSNSRTRHHLRLSFDGVLEFREPQFLILKTQVTIGVPHVGVTVEPLLDPRSISLT